MLITAALWSEQSQSNDFNTTSAFRHCRGIETTVKSMKPIRKFVAVLTLTPVLLFSIVVPGGQIETGNFTNIRELSVITFNIFRTTPGIGSLALVYFILKGSRWAAHAAASLARVLPSPTFSIS
jgi:hypothetical protein